MAIIRRDRPRDEYVLVQAALPHYRAAFVRCLRNLLDHSLVILAGPEHFAQTVTTVYSMFEGVEPVRNRFLFGRRALLQLGVIARASRASVAVLELNPRIINTWLVLIIRRTLRRRTVLWGHAAGRDGRRLAVRRLQERLASALIVYTETEREELEQLQRGVPVYAAPNAAYSLDELPAVGIGGNNLIYVGRLVAEKKCQLMIEGYTRAIASEPSIGDLLIVGSGPLRPELERLVARLGVSDRVHLLGEITAVDDLAALYADCFLALSPGYVGLAATQAALLGVPMLVADAEPHAPEVTLLTAGENAYFFAADDPTSFASLVVALAAQIPHLAGRRPEIAAQARAQFTAEQMARGFADAMLGQKEAV